MLRMEHRVPDAERVDEDGETQRSDRRPWRWHPEALATGRLAVPALLSRLCSAIAALAGRLVGATAGPRPSAARISVSLDALEPRIMLNGASGAEIHGSKWHDLNADGVWDNGEPVLADWEI